MPEIVDNYVKSRFPDMPGNAVNLGNIGEPKVFARDLGHFLYGLQKLDATGAPIPSFENKFAGSNLEFFEAEIDDQLQKHKALVPRDFMLVTFDRAVKNPWKKKPVWLHGNFSAKNILVTDGKLSGVLAADKAVVGDPACDLAIAWFLFDEHVRKIFFGTAEADPATIARARIFALLHALRTYNSGNIDEEIQARDALAEILQDLDYKGEDELFDAHLPRID
ncbi:phosphotransferase [Lactovum odontotermitis]